MLTLGYRRSVGPAPRVAAVNGRHSDEVTRAWGPTAAAAVVASLPPAAMVSGLGCAGLGLATDSATIAASGAVAATVGIMRQLYEGLATSTPADSLSATQREWLVKFRDRTDIPADDPLPVGGLYWAINLAGPFLLGR